MRRIFALIFAAAHFSVQPEQSDTIDSYTLTSERLWASSASVLALVGVVIGGLAVARPTRRFDAV